MRDDLRMWIAEAPGLLALLTVLFVAGVVNAVVMIGQM